MKPFWAVGLGWVFLVLVASVNGYDLYADPLGWLLVMLGLRRLPVAFPRVAALLGLGGLAGTVSVLLWLPSVDQWLREQDPSVAWAANLPQFGWLVLFCLAAAEAAREATEVQAAAWFRTLMVAAAAVALLPVLVLGADLAWLDEVAALLVLVTPVVFVVVVFMYSTRPWSAPIER